MSHAELNSHCVCADRVKLVECLFRHLCRLLLLQLFQLISGGDFNLKTVHPVERQKFVQGDRQSVFPTPYVSLKLCPFVPRRTLSGS